MVYKCKFSFRTIFKVIMIYKKVLYAAKLVIKKFNHFKIGKTSHLNVKYAIYNQVTL